MTAARVLSPVPSPSAMPEAMAITFFSAPATSQPTTSGFVYTRNSSPAKIFCSSWAMWSSLKATTVAAALPDRISCARFGPVSTPTG